MVITGNGSVETETCGGLQWGVGVLLHKQKDRLHSPPAEKTTKGREGGRVKVRDS